MKRETDIFDEAKIYIDNNAMRCEDSVIQIINISQVSVSPIPKLEYPIWGGVGFLAGFLTLAQNILVGFVITICFGVYLYSIYFFNKDQGMYFVLELNSGKLLFFSCKDKDFLNKVVETFMYFMNGEKEPCVINFETCQISDGNMMNSK